MGLLLLLYPWVAPNLFYVHMGVVICMNIVIVTGLGIIAKIGQVSFGHAGFVTLGGYCSALLSLKLGLTPFLGFLVAAAVSAAIAAALGYVILRLRGVYFVLVTFCFGQIITLIALDWTSLTEGANGLTGIAAPNFFGISLGPKDRFYWLAAAAAFAISIFAYALYRSPSGELMSAIADNPRLAESSGVAMRRHQLWAFVIGSAIAGLGGSILTHYIRFISPDAFTFSSSVAYVTMLVVGGRRSVAGPMVGALVLTPLPELLRGLGGFQHVIYGAILILSVRFLPNGLVSLQQTLGRLLIFAMPPKVRTQPPPTQPEAGGGGA